MMLFIFKIHFVYDMLCVDRNNTFYESYNAVQDYKFNAIV